MGRKTAEIRVNARLSSNNDERDQADRAAWERFVTAVRLLAREPLYTGLDVEVNDMGSC